MSRLIIQLVGLFVALALAGCGSSPQTTTLPSPAPVSTDANSAQPTLPEPSPASDSEQSNSPGIAVGEPAPQGMSTGSCVETYSPENLKHRGFAFDGTVSVIELRDDPSMGGGDGGEAAKLPWVTFKVNQWYKGGSGSETSLWMQGIEVSGMDLPIVSTGSIPADIGTRLLVAGEAIGVGDTPEEKIAWSCGFTQPYAQEAAAEWQSAMQ